jgi:hypothetical protein
MREPLVKLAAAARSQTKFTYLDLNHTMNFNAKGKKKVETTELHDVTYIGELPYSRLLEKKGRPLRGKELKAEQMRFDDAVKRHETLTNDVSGSLFYSQMGLYGINLTPSMMASQYKNTIAGQSLLPMCECVMIDSMPLPGAPQRKYRMWVDPAKNQLLRVDMQLLADDVQAMKGGMLTVVWTYIDGVPVVSQSHFDSYMRYGRQVIRVVVDHTYSKFRRFSVTSTIVPDGK